MAPVVSTSLNRGGEEEDASLTTGAGRQVGKIDWEYGPKKDKCLFFLADKTSKTGWKLVYEAERNGIGSKFIVRSVSHKGKRRDVGTVYAEHDKEHSFDTTAMQGWELFWKIKAVFDDIDGFWEEFEGLQVVKFRLTLFDEKNQERIVGAVKHDFYETAFENGENPSLGLLGLFNPSKIQLKPEMVISAPKSGAKKVSMLNKHDPNKGVYRLSYEAFSNEEVPVAENSVMSAKLVQKNGLERKIHLTMLPGSNEDSLRVEFDEPFDAFRAFGVAITQMECPKHLYQLRFIKRFSYLFLLFLVGCFVIPYGIILFGYLVIYEPEFLINLYQDDKEMIWAYGIVWFSGMAFLMALPNDDDEEKEPETQARW